MQGQGELRDQTAEYQERIDDWAKKAVQRFRKAAGGVTPRTCPICGYHGLFPAFGQPPRFDARCGSCGSLERHRLIWLMVLREDFFEDDHAVLHFAPEQQLSGRIRVRVDRYETADLREADILTHRVNIEDTGLPDCSYDRIVCNHVLEHVDDTKALAELFRMLRPGGKALLSTPVIEGWAKTYEPEGIDSREARKLHFGQADHVRFYGRDIRDRIRAAGFQLREVVAEGQDVIDYGLWRGEAVFVATRPREQPE